MTSRATDQSSVSVIITTYDRPDYMQIAVRSVLAQTYRVNEIIIVDDCSPEPLQPFIEEFSDARIHYERLPENRGANYARNRGIEIASSDWIAFLDDDDEWLPTKVAQQMNHMIGSSRSQAWIGSVCSYRFMESGKDRVWGLTGKVDLELLKLGNPYCGASGLIARRDYLLTTPFDEALPCGQDWDIFIRLAKQGDLLYLQDPLFLYRRGSHSSVTLKSKSLKIEELQPRLASIYKHRSWLGEPLFRLRLANQTLAYFPQKTDRPAWVKEAVRRAGIRATVKVLLRKVHSRLPIKGA